MPTLRQLEDIRQTAMSNTGSMVELPFGDETQTLILTVSRDMGKGSWLWMLYRDDGFTSALEWSQLTHDANYIHALLENAHPGFLVKTRRTTEVNVDESQYQSQKIRRGTLEGNPRTFR